MGTQRHTNQKIALKKQFVDRFTQLIERLGANSHAEIGKAIGRDRSTIDSWLNIREPALPDWADLHGLQSYAERKGVVAEFFRLVGEGREYRFQMKIPARSGALAAVLVRIFQDGGGLVRLGAELDKNKEKAIVSFTLLLPGPPERLLEDLRPIAESIKLLTDMA
ncbi:MAG: hypothetical protein WAM82_22565 [Thermoanaerobaculia bacterium]